MPKLGICKCCSGKVSSEAEFCPHCGQPDPYTEVQLPGEKITQPGLKEQQPESIEEREPKFFICHASEDKSFVERLNVHLKHEGVSTWFDGVEIKAGDNLVDKILREGIPLCSHAAIVLSQASMEKEGWVKKEKDTIIQLNIEGQIKVVPLLIDDVKIPPELKGIRYVSFIGWPKSDAIFTNSVRELVGSLIPHRDDLSRFNSPTAFKSYWTNRPITGNEAKLEAYQILTILGDRFGDLHSRADAMIFLVSRKLKKGSQDREDFIDFVLQYDEMQSRWQLQLEKANQLKGKHRYDDAEEVYKHIWEVSQKEYWRAAVELFKLYADRKTDEHNKLAISVLNELEATGIHPIEFVEIICRAAFILKDLGDEDRAKQKAQQVESIIRNIDQELKAVPSNRRSKKRRIVTTTTKKQLASFYRAISDFDKADELEHFFI